MDSDFYYLEVILHSSPVFLSCLTREQDGTPLGQPGQGVGRKCERAGCLGRGDRRRLLVLMPHVVHDETAGQRQGQFRERRYTGVRRCGNQGGYLRGAGRRRSGLLRRTRRLPGAVRVAQQAFPGAAVEHRLDVLPGVHHLVRRGAGQFHVPAPRIEIRRVRLHVFVRRADTVRVEDELVGREEQAAVRALDAFRARAIVTGW